MSSRAPDFDTMSREELIAGYRTCRETYIRDTTEMRRQIKAKDTEIAELRAELKGCNKQLHRRQRIDARPDLGGVDKLVLNDIHRRYHDNPKFPPPPPDPDTGNPTPILMPVAWVAQDLGLSPKTVGRTYDALQEHGWIAVQQERERDDKTGEYRTKTLVAPLTDPVHTPLHVTPAAAAAAEDDSSAAGKKKKIEKPRHTKAACPTHGEEYMVADLTIHCAKCGYVHVKRRRLLHGPSHDELHAMATPTPDDWDIPAPDYPPDPPIAASADEFPAETISPGDNLSPGESTPEPAQIRPVVPLTPEWVLTEDWYDPTRPDDGLSQLFAWALYEDVEQATAWYRAEGIRSAFTRNGVVLSVTGRGGLGPVDFALYLRDLYERGDLRQLRQIITHRGGDAERIHPLLQDLGDPIPDPEDAA